MKLSASTVSVGTFLIVGSFLSPVSLLHGLVFMPVIIFLVNRRGWKSAEYTVWIGTIIFWTVTYASFLLHGGALSSGSTLGLPWSMHFVAANSGGYEGGMMSYALMYLINYSLSILLAAVGVNLAKKYLRDTNSILASVWLVVPGIVAMLSGLQLFRIVLG